MASLRMPLALLGIFSLVQIGETLYSNLLAKFLRNFVFVFFVSVVFILHPFFSLLFQVLVSRDVTRAPPCSTTRTSSLVPDLGMTARTFGVVEQENRPTAARSRKVSAK